MIAPTPSAVSWTAPRLRFKLCSPVSLHSPSSMLIGFLTNKGLPAAPPLAIAAPNSSDLVLLIIGTSLGKTSSAAQLAARGQRSSPRPNQIYRNAQQHNHQTRPRRLRLVEQQHEHNGHGRHYIQQRNERIAKRPIRPLRTRPLGA